MPDWTYHPLAPIAAAALGQRRPRVLALRLLAFLIRRAGGGRWIPLVFDHSELPPQWRDRFGASVPAWIAREAITVLPVQGASIIRLTEPALAPAVRALADPTMTVLATPIVLTAAGPGWFSRVIEAAVPTSPPPPLGEEVPLNCVRWPGWAWGPCSSAVAWPLPARSSRSSG